jgi:N-ethylmaleimide reductase
MSGTAPQSGWAPDKRVSPPGASNEQRATSKEKRIMYDELWTPVRVGAIELPHRLGMAPMTRDRSAFDGTPTPLNAEYYAQRASMGLLITEGTQPSEDGQGYLLTPGVHTGDHVAGWRRVADAVHAGGGRLVIQLMHTGRINHPSNTPHGRQPVAPSPVAANGQMFTAQGMQDFPVPRELDAEGIAATVDNFRRAAAAAIRAGADGVEIHGANGYLVHQFLSSNANQRTDSHGGSTENRIRFAVEVAAAVAAEIGADRTGIRLSPGNPYNDITEDDTRSLYLALAQALAPLDLAYLHLVIAQSDPLLKELRVAWPGALLVNTPAAALEERAALVADGTADVVTVGQLALANPDLVARMRAGGPFNEPDPSTYYGGDHRGYTDYPALEAGEGTQRQA